MPRRMRIAKPRRIPEDPRVRTFLLRPWRHDFFGQVHRLGGEAYLRDYWSLHRASLLAEFARVAPTLRPDRLERCGGRPLGAHLFEGILVPMGTIPHSEDGSWDV